MELQKGKIQVNSKLGRGSEFYFSLELSKVESSIIETITESNINKKPLGNLSILLCEDNILNQRLVSNVIQKFGFQLTIANNGQEGIDLLINNEYDLILMDLQMPVRDGYQTTIYIRNELQLDIPIIAMTAHSLIGEQQKCFEIGMNAYIAKPFKQQDLWNEIYAIIEKKSANKTAITLDLEEDVVAKKNIKKIDLSYLDELSEGNSDDEFKKEMIGLFIKKVPTDLLLLEKAIREKENNIIQRIAHDMKSSLSMFRLDKEVRYLDEIENSITTSTFNRKLTNQFDGFKHGLIEVIDLLSEAQYPYN